MHIRAYLAGGRLCIVVRDDGRGLPRDATALASGWGLRSVQAQLHALGGGLALRSAPGRGTCATLTLPLGLPPQPAAPSGALVPRSRP
ncbi:ATP-binding protein [Pelomonas sp. P8]|uniref:histidine kinase n=2 Tax=Pelomonas cellulosilytica TaxID=2906762 RepID=A0ABS8XSZ6_9BURK|nr:ATP-binding protein [Pelomonas sp. P8]